MKLLTIALLVSSSCGLPVPYEPTAGIYDLTMTPTTTTCPAKNNPSDLTVELAKENGEWALYGCNSDCSQKLLLAVSSDGSTFRPSGCSGPWCEDITFNLTCETVEGKTTISGESTIVLTMPNYASGSCTEVDSIEGVKR